MKSIWTKITLIGTAIAGAVFLAFKFLLVKEPKTEQDFPKSAEKKAAEAEVKKTEEELEQVEKKEYSNEEIEKKFNT